jgi:uncharacterized membrane protein
LITGSSSAEVDAPIERCWALVEDVPSAPEWQGGLIRIDVLERDDRGRALVCDTLSDAKMVKVHARVRFEYEHPTRLSWRMLDGELDAMEGSWELEDLGGGRTRATYSLAVDPGPMSRMLRAPIERAARMILVNGRAAELSSALRRRREP